MIDFATIRGQAHAKRAIEVAACGGHSLTLTGSPGQGKTLLTQALLTLAHEAAGLVLQGFEALAWVAAALRGEGEASGQARPGLLVLERLDCFGLSALQIQRLGVMLDQLPAVQLAVTRQPCPCGWYGDPLIECECSAWLIERHQRRLRALLERTPIEVEIPRRDYEVILDRRVPEASATVAARVHAGWDRQRHRFAGLPLTRNAQMDHGQLLSLCPLEASAEKLFQAAYQHLRLSARSADGVLAVARTIADLAGSQVIQANHIAEAIQYHPRHTHI